MITEEAFENREEEIAIRCKISRLSSDGCSVRKCAQKKTFTKRRQLLLSKDELSIKKIALKICSRKLKAIAWQHLERRESCERFN